VTVVGLTARRIVDLFRRNPGLHVPSAHAFARLADKDY
jgi:hypothetical protein